MSVSIAGGFLNDALKKFEQQVSQPEAQMGATTVQAAAPEELEEVSQSGTTAELATGATTPLAASHGTPSPEKAAEQAAAELAAELAAEAAELAKVSQLSDDLLYHMLESISDSTLLPNVLSNTQKNIRDDNNYLLSFKQYTNAEEQYTDYTIYYKDNDEALNTGTNFLDKSFNYFVYSPDGTNVEITPIKKYYTLNDILKHICNLFDNIIIISKKISSSPISVLYQYKDYKHKSLIFIYNSTYNDILKNIRGFIDIIPENTRPDNPITIDEYNSIKTEIYNE